MIFCRGGLGFLLSLLAYFCLFVCLTFSHHLVIFLFSCVRTTILYSLCPSSAYLICIFFYYASHLSFLSCFVSVCVGWLLAHLLDFWERKSCSPDQPRTLRMTVNWSSNLHHPRAGITSAHRHQDAPILVCRILYFLSLAPGWLISWLVRDFVVVVVVPF